MAKIFNLYNRALHFTKRNGLRASLSIAKERLDHTHQSSLTKLEQQYVEKGWGQKTASVAPLTKDMPETTMTQQQIMAAWTYQPLISVVVPTYETAPAYLEDLLDSLVHQTYPHWQLVIADASDVTDAVKNTLQAYCDGLGGIRLYEHANTDTQSDAQSDAQSEQQSESQTATQTNAEADAKVDAKTDQQLACANPTICYVKLPNNQGISANTNAGFSCCQGEYIALLDHDDALTYDALFYMVEQLQPYGDKAPDTVVAVYSDEDKTDSDMTHFYEPHMKPDFNEEMLCTNNYVCHFLMVEARLMRELQLRPAYDGAQDYDLILRIAAHIRSQKKETGQAPLFLHVPRILYHWRCHPASTAGNSASKSYAYGAGLRALADYYNSQGYQGFSIAHSAHRGFYTTTWQQDFFSRQPDVAAICGRVVQKGVVIGGPTCAYARAASHMAGADQGYAGAIAHEATRETAPQIPLFHGLCIGYGGYQHRARFPMEVDGADERALRLRPDLGMSLEEALAQGMRLVYDPGFIVRV